MHSLERVPAVRRLDTNRADLFAVEITNDVTPPEIENFVGLLEGAIALHPRIDLLIRLSGIGEIDLDGLLRDTKETLRADLGAHVGRVALVGSDEDVAIFARLMKPGETMETRRFSAHEESEAWQWLAAHENRAD